MAHQVQQRPFWILLVLLFLVAAPQQHVYGARRGQVFPALVQELAKKREPVIEEKNVVKVVQGNGDAPVRTNSSVHGISLIDLDSWNPISSSPYSLKFKGDNEKVIYMITPTYPHSPRYPNLVAVQNALARAGKVVWILIEDARTLDPYVTEEILKYSTPNIEWRYITTGGPGQDSKCRGRHARNQGMQFALEHYKSLKQVLEKKSLLTGFLYFGDDDNTYDGRLWDEIRKTKTVGAWPVGNMMNSGFSTPIVRDGKILDFYDPYRRRVYMLDMAGFAINMNHMLKISSDTNYWKLTRCYRYKQESKLLEKTRIAPKAMEPLGDNCTKILSWHTQTRFVSLRAAVTRYLKRYSGTNLESLKVINDHYHA